MTFSASPPTNRELLTALYDGEIFCLAAGSSSRQLVADVVALLQGQFGDCTDWRQAQFQLPNEEFLSRVARVRAALLADESFAHRLRSVVKDNGFDLSDNAYDPLRLRAVMHLGHENARAHAAYSTHRDCWYANPQSQINWWIPLHDVGDGETFSFFPEFFNRSVENNSDQFDYDTWISTIGWQSKNAGQAAVYPSVPGGRIEAALGRPFSCKAAEIVLFSASQLHQSLHNVSGRTRFSLDFRTVCLSDEAQGLGAPNVDNHSTGCALKDYKRFA